MVLHQLNSNHVVAQQNNCVKAIRLAAQKVLAIVHQEQLHGLRIEGNQWVAASG